MAGFFSFGKKWTKMGPFNLGPGVFKSLAVISVAGVMVLVWIGVQPPNDQALTVTLVAVGVLTVAWWAGVRRVFKGPPVTSIAAEPAMAGGNVTPAGAFAAPERE
jgi:hypothetical protein